MLNHLLCQVLFNSSIKTIEHICKACLKRCIKFCKTAMKRKRSSVELSLPYWISISMPRPDRQWPVLALSITSVHIYFCSLASRIDGKFKTGLKSADFSNIFEPQLSLLPCDMELQCAGIKSFSITKRAEKIEIQFFTDGKVICEPRHLNESNPHMVCRRVFCCQLFLSGQQFFQTI